MKIKNKGRKIYKTKEKNYYGKSPAAKVLSASLTILLIGGIGFIGYSVAGPVLDFTKKAGDDSAGTDGEPVTEGYTSLEPSTDITSSVPVTTASAHTSVTTTETTMATTEEDTVMSHMVDAGVYHAYALDEADMVSLDTIRKAISEMPSPQDIDFIEVPLKLDGGKILYATEAREAAFTGALQSSLKAEDIAETIIDAGYRPAAYVSTFKDHIVPLTLPETGYSFEDESTQWLDNKPEKNGKPWLDPFSEQAVGYISFLTGEIAGAGFERVICSDFVFPKFYDSDYELIGEKYRDESRYLAMTSAANQIYDSILSNGSSMMLEVSVADMLTGRNDIIKPMVLSVNTIVLDINSEELKTLSDSGKISGISGSSSDMIVSAYSNLKEQLSDFNVVVRISGEISSDEVSAAKEKLSSAGCKSYIISVSKVKETEQTVPETTASPEYSFTEETDSQE